MRCWKLTDKTAKPVEVGDTFMVNAPRINARAYIGKICVDFVEFGIIKDRVQHLW